MVAWKTLFVDEAAKMGITLSHSQVVQFETYMHELKEWNKQINITAITSTEDIVIKHFIDSLSVLSCVDLSGSVVDIGSGAGFPGIPLKIVRKEITLVLIEAKRKKANFMRHIIRRIDLQKTDVFKGRAEEYKPAALFDYAISRALSDPQNFSRIALPLVHKGAKLVCMQGKNNAVSLDQLSSMGLQAEKSKEFILPGGRGKRHITILRNVSRETSN